MRSKAISNRMTQTRSLAIPKRVNGRLSTEIACLSIFNVKLLSRSLDRNI